MNGHSWKDSITKHFDAACRHVSLIAHGTAELLMLHMSLLAHNSFSCVTTIQLLRTNHKNSKCAAISLDTWCLMNWAHADHLNSRKFLSQNVYFSNKFTIITKVWDHEILRPYGMQEDLKSLAGFWRKSACVALSGPTCRCLYVVYVKTLF